MHESGVSGSEESRSEEGSSYDEEEESENEGQSGSKGEFTD